MNTVALMGNPNVGKSTVFNHLTGLNQHTGNWPGKTVATARGMYQWAGTSYTLVDLPGTYSLTGKSQEEEIAVDYLKSGEPDCTVVICDATVLERNLILVLAVMELTKKLIVCVNLMDEAEKKHIKVDCTKLSALLGLPVIATSAKGGKGMKQLQNAIADVTSDYHIPKPRQWDYVYDTPALQAKERILRAEEIAKAVVSGGVGYTEEERTLDKILCGPWTGIPVMLLLLTGVFWLTIAGANVPSSLLHTLFMEIGEWLRGATVGLPLWLSGVLIDGVFETVAKVVAVMLPPMAIFFPLFTLLEDFGYLPRVAYVLDRPFARCGACGKQALTTCMGFGCNAAGVVGCRIIDSPRERLIAILTNAFVPCNGRFPALIALIVLLIAPTTSGSLSALILTGFVVLGVAMTMVAAWVLSKTVLKGESSSFTLELPSYRHPKLGEVLVRSILDRTIFVLGRAVMVAAPAGAIIWCLTEIQIGDVALLQVIATNLDGFAMVFGLNGAILLAMMLGFPANELVIPLTLMIVGNGFGVGSEVSNGTTAEILMAAGWTWKTALCAMVFMLFHWPCSTTCITIYKETKSMKWTAFAFLLPTFFGMALCFVLNLFL